MRYTAAYFQKVTLSLRDSTKNRAIIFSGKEWDILAVHGVM
jgi:hypothetical protein